ncbi:MAG: hypothetical protein OEY34_09335, partial [Cyclobacteriaceae bacterium]|nr:hypothetical protein [Cyclobacteriaceae bacterium]
MERPLILFKYSPLYSILCIALGILFAFILYRKQTLWSARINYFLFFLRATLVTFIAILLLSPFIKYLQNTFETPTVAIALDNSLSVSKALSTEDLMHFANTWKKDLEEKGFAVDFFTLEDELPLKTTDSIKTNASTTNITSLLASVENSYEGRNLSGVILASDGIINAGSSPEYKNYSFPISTVALGDTIPKTDLAIKNLRYNKFSYQGNKFPVVIDVYNVGFENSSALLTVSMGNNTKSSKVINFTKSREINTVEFELESNKTGLQQVSVSLEEKSGEYTYENNKKRFVIDVINGSEKILLVANSPHPDIQALRSVIEKNKNYSFHLYIPGISTPPASEKKYDLIILYQIPGLRGNAEEILKSLLIENTSFLYIIGNQTNLRKFNTFNTSIEIQSNQGEKDQVSSWYNSAFPHF